MGGILCLYMQQPIETHPRSIAKSVSYRVLSIIADYSAAYLFTRNLALSAGIVLVVDFYSTVLYYFHERIWAHVEWGRRPDQHMHETPVSARIDA